MANNNIGQEVLIIGIVNVVAGPSSSLEIL
jgi:hypothetical protein